MTQAANNTPSAEELELINSYTRNPLTAEEVYCFNLTLCDNEVDRDFERFSINALKGLCELFPGRTGICDHNMSAKNVATQALAVDMFVRVTEKEEMKNL